MESVEWPTQDEREGANHPKVSFGVNLHERSPVLHLSLLFLRQHGPFWFAERLGDIRWDIRLPQSLELY